VNALGTGPDPACTTIGVPLASSRSQTPSSNGSSRWNAPTCTCTLNTSTPSSTSAPTYAAASGSGKNVADHRLSGTSAAKVRAQSFRYVATPGLCAYGNAEKRRTPRSRSSATRSSTDCR